MLPRGISALCTCGRIGRRIFFLHSEEFSQLRFEVLLIAPFISPIFSFTAIMNGVQDSTSAAASSQSAQRQVRVQLVSKQEDIALPESTGPILVPTGTNAFWQLTASLLCIYLCAH